MITRGEEELIDAVAGALHPSIPASAVLAVVDAVKRLNVTVLYGEVRHIEDCESTTVLRDSAEYRIFLELPTEF